MHTSLYTTLGLLSLSALSAGSPFSNADIPESKATVSVKVINANIGENLDPKPFFDPVINGTVFSRTPFYSFLIEHTSPNGTTSRMLFDQGIRKDPENFPPEIVESVKATGLTLTTDLDVADVLTAGDILLSSIAAIIWSHGHFDHIGDPARFPASTSIIVGPGFTQAFMPGYPDNPAAPFFASAIAEHTVTELDFTRGSITIGGFRALDWFGDGSFYVIDTPGHAVGHISALARTTADTFALLGGDVCHHAGSLRPSRYTPLPKKVVPSPFKYLSPVCVGEFALNVHPNRSRVEPYMDPAAGGFNLDRDTMVETLGIVQRLDGEPNVFTIISHDVSVLDKIALFPEAVNDWKRKGWKEGTRWAFLTDFEVS